MMFDFDKWQIQNQKYLSQLFDSLRERLACLENSELASAQELISNIALPDWDTDEIESYLPAILVIKDRFDLSRFESQVIALCALQEFDPTTSALLSKSPANGFLPYPTIGLALTLLDDPNQQEISPLGTLRSSRLIEISAEGTFSCANHRIAISEKIRFFLSGLSFLDPAIERHIRPASLYQIKPRAIHLCQAQTIAGDKIIETAVQGQLNHKVDPFLVTLQGSDSASRLETAAYVCDQLDLQLFSLDWTDPSLSEADLADILAVWNRDRVLEAGALYIRLGNTQHTTRFVTLLEQSQGLYFLDNDSSDKIRRTLNVEILAPNSIEQKQFLDRMDTTLSPEELTRLTGQFQLSFSEMNDALDELEQNQFAQGNANFDACWEAFKDRTRPCLEEMAQRIEIKATWEDIVLDEVEQESLHQISSQVRHRGTVLDDWGFRQKFNRGLGVTALFSGESGTGKTMAAEVIANELKLDLYRIDLSSVINKYVGETEKNLKKLFDAAERGGAILFFDEADSLFAKRTELKSSNDRFANIETNYLLQRMESFRGLAILATNNKSNIDHAFLRRLRFVVDFKFPDAKHRKKIWQRAFPDSLPRDYIDFDQLSRFRLTGGNIFNIALNAGFHAAQANKNVDMDCVLHSARLESQKLQLNLSFNEIGESRLVGGVQ